MPPFITSVELTNYRSIASCKVKLGSLNILVGRNGAGKSNFLDALTFLRDATRYSLDQAVRRRGGIAGVWRRAGRRPTHFAIKVRFRLPSGQEGEYGFRIGAMRDGRYAVQSEECRIDGRPRHHFVVKDGRVEGSPQVLSPTNLDRLYLVAAAGLPEFEEVYGGFEQMGFYNLDPAVMANPQSAHSPGLLQEDGSNTAAVLAGLAAHAPDRKERIEQYLQAVVPGVVDVNRIESGLQATIGIRRLVQGASAPLLFPAHAMSDGALRALGLLLALFQCGAEPWERLPLIGIEEPELALHPAAIAVLLDALREASRHTQVLVTSHSPDLLDHKDIGVEELIAVDWRDGSTVIGQPGAAAIGALRDRLYTAGELLRMDQL